MSFHYIKNKIIYQFAIYFKEKKLQALQNI